MEVINPDYHRGPFKAALFDFDGTLSLLRHGWETVMIPMMVDALAETGTYESRRQLILIASDAVSRLTGKQTIYQMLWLTEAIKERGGTPESPLAYKQEFLKRLMQDVGERIEVAKLHPETALVPGVQQFLARLQDNGLRLFLASGTDVDSVREEASVLGLATFFGPHIYGAIADSTTCSKAAILANILDESGLRGEEVVGFGDGPVEIEEVKRIGGLAVGIASNEETRRGVNEKKRRRLIAAGADLIVADFTELSATFPSMPPNLGGIDDAVAEVVAKLKPRPPAKTDLTSVGRDDPCPCGSGMKYKRCCGQKP